MEVAAQEIEALPAFPEVDHTGLVRVQAQTEITQLRSCSPLSLLGLLLGVASTTR